jgi:ClpP class serine protease
MEEVDARGRGRVFTGRQAKKEKLVDELGGLHDAIAYAKSRAGYDEDESLEVVMLPYAPSSLIGTLLKLAGGGGSASSPVSSSEVAPIHDLLRHVPASVLTNPTVPQARLPYDIVID